MYHRRIRVRNDRVEGAPLDYSDYPGRDGWTDVRIAEMPPGAIQGSQYLYSPGGDVESIGKGHSSKVEGDFLYFNASFVSGDGRALGRTIIDGEERFTDIRGKTEYRQHLWSDGQQIRVGNVDDDRTVWAAQGGPVLLQNGRNVVKDRVSIESIQSDIANGRNPRTAAGIKDDGTLILIFADGRATSDPGLTLDELATVFGWLGCVDAINLDGGGSSTVYSNSDVVNNSLNIGDGHVCDLSLTRPRSVHHAIAIQVDVDQIRRDTVNHFEGYRVTSPFGWRNDPFTGQRAFHTGIDLVKSHQAPIYAFVPGEVIHAKEGVAGSGFGGFGVVVAIKDKYGALHCYCHLDFATVAVGDRVERGKMIGRQGNTGRSTGSHLHYEVRKVSNPQFGWRAGHDHVYDPGEYLDAYGVEEERKRNSRLLKLPNVQGTATVVVNGDQKETGYIIDGHTYVPIRFVGEALGASVGWDGPTKTATVKTNN